MQTYIDKNIIYDWLNINISLKKIAYDLNQIGFESTIIDNAISVSIPSNREDCNYIIGIIKEISILYNV